MQVLGNLSLAMFVLAGCSSRVSRSSAEPTHQPTDQNQALQISALDSIDPFQAGRVAMPAQVNSQAFDIQTLPVFVEQSPTGPLSSTQTAGRAVSELSIVRDGQKATVQVTPQPGMRGRVTIADQRARGANGLSVVCGREASVPLLVELFSQGVDGDATYTRVVGYFDAGRCLSSESGRRALRPKTIFPGYLFGFRTCREPDCSSGGERLTLLTPGLIRADLGGLGQIEEQEARPFGQITVSLERGMAVSFSANVDQHTFGTLFQGAKPPFLPPAGKQMAIGLDLVQATEESEPSATAFVGEASQVEFTFAGALDAPD